MDNRGCRIRVLHCPEIVAGNPQQLARFERRLGLDSWNVAFWPSKFKYEADEILCRGSTSGWANEWKRWQLLLRATRHFDVIHYNSGQSLFPSPRTHTVEPSVNGSPKGRLRRLLSNQYARFFELRDLVWLKSIGKAIFVTFQGDDARQGDSCERLFAISPVGEVEPGYYTREGDAHKRRRIAQFERYADGIFAVNPDLLHVLPPRSRFMPYGHVDLSDWKPVDSANTVPLIVHAPSHRRVKGTRFVLDAVERLRADGVALDFRLVEDLPNHEARQIFEKADLLIDQLLCGWYGGLAVEFMALGKPVMCYLRENDLRFIPDKMREEIPIINVTAATLYGKLRDWLARERSDLQQVGCRGRRFVERWHDPHKIAEMLKSEYEAALRRRDREATRDHTSTVNRL